MLMITKYLKSLIKYNSNLSYNQLGRNLSRIHNGSTIIMIELYFGNKEKVPKAYRALIQYNLIREYIFLK
jgi:hypothetical protein